MENGQYAVRVIPVVLAEIKQRTTTMSHEKDFFIEY